MYAMTRDIITDIILFTCKKHLTITYTTVTGLYTKRENCSSEAAQCRTRPTITPDTTCKIKIVQVERPIAAPDLTLTQDTTCKIKIVQVERPIAAPDLQLHRIQHVKLRLFKWSGPLQHPT